MAARDENFLNDGTVDPFSGLAPAESEDAVENARRARLREAAQRTANINNVAEARGSSNSGSNIDPRTGEAFDRFAKPTAPGSTFSGFMNESLDTVKENPWLPLLPLAPLGMAAAAPAAAGSGTIAGFGGGSGTVGLAAESAPFMMASPYAAAGAGAAAPAGAVATLPGMIGADAAKYGIPAAIALAPTVINEVLGGRTKEQDALIAKQEQLAHEAQVRQGQQQDARMNALGQQLLAFNPTNQMMAQMFGPGAAFTPEQVATMAQGQPPPALDQSLVDYRGTDPEQRAKVAEFLRRKQEFEQAEAGRRDMIMGGFQQPGSGPAPMQMAAPQAARRF